MLRKLLSLSIIFSFFLTSLGPLPQAHADAVPGLPTPGTMVNLSPAYEPVMIKGLTVHKDNPFLFDFIVDVGQDKMSGEPLKKEGEKLIKYFLASLAIPDKDLWVNLSPYEKNRMIPDVLGQTDMGRDLLEQDYILKQITASLIYPERKLGRTFWDKVYAKAQQMYGSTEIPVNTFNKVWIMADRAEVLEHDQTAFVGSCHLKVMLEEDYLALQKHSGALGASSGAFSGSEATKQFNNTHALASQIVKEIVLPELEKEINTGKNFANLRQIFNSVILSSWYKKNLKEALLNQVYADKDKVKGINLNDPTIKEQIYEQYLKAYKKGVFNYIKEDVNAAGATVPRKYFSGGTILKVKQLIVEKLYQHLDKYRQLLGDSTLVNFFTGFKFGAASSNAAMLTSADMGWLRQVHEKVSDALSQVTTLITSEHMDIATQKGAYKRIIESLRVASSILPEGQKSAYLELIQLGQLEENPGQINMADVRELRNYIVHVKTQLDARISRAMMTVLKTGKQLDEIARETGLQRIGYVKVDGRLVDFSEPAWKTRWVGPDSKVEYSYFALAGNNAIDAPVIKDAIDQALKQRRLNDAIRLFTLNYFLFVNDQKALGVEISEKLINAYKGDFRLVGKMGGTEIQWALATPAGIVTPISVLPASIKNELGETLESMAQNPENSIENIMQRIVSPMKELAERVGPGRIRDYYFLAPGFFGPDGALVESQKNIPNMLAGFRFDTEIPEYLKKVTGGKVAIKGRTVHDGTGHALGDKSVYGPFSLKDTIYGFWVGSGIASRVLPDGLVPFTGDQELNYLHNEGSHNAVWNPQTGRYEVVFDSTKGFHPDFTTPGTPFFGRQDLEDRTKGGAMSNAFVEEYERILSVGVADPQYEEALKIKELLQETGKTKFDREVQSYLAKRRPALMLRVFQGRAHELGLGIGALLWYLTHHEWKNGSRFDITTIKIPIGGVIAQLDSLGLFNEVKKGVLQVLKENGASPGDLDLISNNIVKSPVDDDMRELLGGLPSKDYEKTSQAMMTSINEGLRAVITQVWDNEKEEGQIERRMKTMQRQLLLAANLEKFMKNLRALCTLRPDVTDDDLNLYLSNYDFTESDKFTDNIFDDKKVDAFKTVLYGEGLMAENTPFSEIQRAFMDAVDVENFLKASFSEDKIDYMLQMFGYFAQDYPPDSPVFNAFKAFHAKRTQKGTEAKTQVAASAPVTRVALATPASAVVAAASQEVKPEYWTLKYKDLFKRARETWKLQVPRDALDNPILRDFIEGKISLRKAEEDLNFNYGKEFKNGQEVENGNAVNIKRAILTVLKFSFDFYSTDRFLLNDRIETALVLYLVQNKPRSRVEPLRSITRLNLSGFTDSTRVGEYLNRLDAKYEELLAVRDLVAEPLSKLIISEVDKPLEISAADSTKFSLKVVGPEANIEVIGSPALDTSVLNGVIPAGTKKFQIGGAHNIMAVLTDNKLRFFWFKNEHKVVAFGNTIENVASINISPDGNSLRIHGAQGITTPKDLDKLSAQLREGREINFIPLPIIIRVGDNIVIRNTAGEEVSRFEYVATSSFITQIMEKVRTLMQATPDYTNIEIPEISGEFSAPFMSNLPQSFGIKKAEGAGMEFSWTIPRDNARNFLIWLGEELSIADGEASASNKILVNRIMEVTTKSDLIRNRNIFTEFSPEEIATMFGALSYSVSSWKDIKSDRRKKPRSTDTIILGGKQYSSTNIPLIPDDRQVRIFEFSDGSFIFDAAMTVQAKIDRILSLANWLQDISSQTLEEQRKIAVRDILFRQSLASNILDAVGTNNIADASRIKDAIEESMVLVYGAGWNDYPLTLAGANSEIEMNAVKADINLIITAQWAIEQLNQSYLKASSDVVLMYPKAEKVSLYDLKRIMLDLLYVMKKSPETLQALYKQSQESSPKFTEPQAKLLTAYHLVKPNGTISAHVKDVLLSIFPKGNVTADNLTSPIDTDGFYITEALAKAFDQKIGNFTVSGRPGAGKDTLIDAYIRKINKLLPADRQIVTVVMGDYFRGITRLVKGKDKPGDKEKYEKYKSLMSEDDIKAMLRGDLINDETAFRVINEILKEERIVNAKHIFFNGFPRNMVQWKALQEGRILLRGQPLAMNFFLDIELPKEAALARAEQRTRDLIRIGDPPRPDDNPETVENRQTVYDDETKPMVGIIEREKSVEFRRITSYFPEFNDYESKRNTIKQFLKTLHEFLGVPPENASLFNAAMMAPVVGLLERIEQYSPFRNSIHINNIARDLNLKHTVIKRAEVKGYEKRMNIVLFMDEQGTKVDDVEALLNNPNKVVNLISTPDDKEGVVIFTDAAMLESVTFLPQVRRAPGGIDLNTSNGMQWKVSKDGKGVEMNVDPAMVERVRREGINSLSPVIFRITPITSIWPLVGLQAPVNN